MKTDHGRLLSLSDLEQLANTSSTRRQNSIRQKWADPFSRRLDTGKIRKFEQPNDSFYLPPAPGMLESVVRDEFREDLPIDNTVFVGNKFSTVESPFKEPSLC
jgi:hypothetical protein